jgi:hypothetical protein
MQRYEAINEIITRHGFKNYLEIGVFYPDECFNQVRCGIKHSVDPGYEVPEGQNPATYKFESDNFFNLLREGYLNLPKDYKWDVIFIDGLHISDQVYRDFLNAKKHLSPNGYILFHDCNPPNIHMAREDYYVNGKQQPWNGTVWKAIQRIRTEFDLDFITIDDDWGIGVCRLNKPASVRLSPEINPFYDYNRFSEHRNLILNLKQSEEFLSWLNSYEK